MMVLQTGLCLLLVLVLAMPLGGYIERVMHGERTILSPVLYPCERLLYRRLHVDADRTMDWIHYLAAVLVFSAGGFGLLLLLLLLQGWLPLNPQGVSGLPLSMAFNTAASFVTNTDWQAYSGEIHLSYLTQAAGLTVQNFVSAGTGIAVLFAFFRGLERTESLGIGNFWADLTRAVLYVLLPLSFALALVLSAQGVVQSFAGVQSAALLEPQVLTDALRVAAQAVPQGPVASQTAIAQLGTNGGGFFGANAAHPLANPTPLTNLLEMLAILLLPAALCFSFGRAVHRRSQGIAVLAAMLLLLMVSWTGITLCEQSVPVQMDQAPAVTAVSGNMEGKETRFGIVDSASWAAFTTAASNGSANASFEGMSPGSVFFMLFNMQLGEVAFGGVGCGLYGMLGFVLLTVFLAGLMVGRTPEFLGKKIGPFEMKMALVICLTGPLLILAGTGAAVWALPMEGADGAHAFTQLLYACSSAAGNNGSALAGLSADTLFFNLLLGILMLAARFVPMAAVLAAASSLASRRCTAVSEGTLRTDRPLFVALLLMVVLLVGALGFLPALALGPVAEFLSML